MYEDIIFLQIFLVPWVISVCDFTIHVISAKMHTHIRIVCLQDSCRLWKFWLYLTIIFPSLLQALEK